MKGGFRTVCLGGLVTDLSDFLAWFLTVGGDRQTSGHCQKQQLGEDHGAVYRTSEVDRKKKKSLGG